MDTVILNGRGYFNMFVWRTGEWLAWLRFAIRLAMGFFPDHRRRFTIKTARPLKNVPELFRAGPSAFCVSSAAGPKSAARLRRRSSRWQCRTTDVGTVPRWRNALIQNTPTQHGRLKPFLRFHRDAAGPAQAPRKVAESRATANTRHPSSTNVPDTKTVLQAAMLEAFPKY